MSAIQMPSRYAGCLLGGAVGDALGAPVEFIRMLSALRARAASRTSTDVEGEVPIYGRTGSVTENTQTMLFTADGLLRASSRQRNPLQVEVIKMVHDAYLRWLRTQLEPYNEEEINSDEWLLLHQELWEQRTPGGVSIAALRSGRVGSTENPLNDSLGSGGATRVAPVGLWADRDQAFIIGCRIAALTHGHPNAYLSAGALAAIISAIMAGDSLDEALTFAFTELSSMPGGGEVIASIERGLAAGTRPVSPESIAKLGEGWTADEALSIAICCAVAAGNDYSLGVRTAADHPGDTDSTASIAGNILGALLGVEAIPPRWLEALELKYAIEQIANDLYRCRAGETGWEERYPLG